jgi:meiotic recombination protein SPO11
MTPQDIKTGQDLMKEDFIKANPAWLKVRAAGSPPARARAHNAHTHRPFAARLLSLAHAHTPPAQELQTMVETKEKAEIQALSSFDFQYLTQVFLPQKLAAGDWI